MARFQILAAIDLRGGRVVRLREGDFARETVYDDDPGEAAGRLIGDGAEALHVVDLDGARAGSIRNGASIEAITLRAGSVPVEVGGGIREVATAAGLLSSGVRRIVLATAAIERPSFARDAVAALGTGSVAVAVDVRGGLVFGRAWRQDQPGAPVERVLEGLAVAGVSTIEVTAIERDGTLEGPDLGLLERLVRTTGFDVIASGGIRSIEDLLAVRDIGCGGAIVGRAIYEGSLDLAAARLRLG